MLDRWREEAIEAQARHERWLDPMVGDRRAQSLVPVPGGQAGNAEAHRRSAVGLHVLEVFTTQGWTVAGLATNGDEAQRWLGEPESTADGPV